MQARSESEANWESKYAEIESLHQSIQEQLSAASSERDNLRQENVTLEKQLADGQITLNELQQKLAQTVSELSASVRGMQQAQAELKASYRRADEAEKAQSNLQTDGIALMRSLKEMRPKIVELTDAKLNLGEKVDSLTRNLRARDDTIAQLEASLEELRDKHADAEGKRRELDTVLEKERSSSQESASESQQAYSALQEELEELRTTARNLEGERSEYRQMASKHLQEVDRLNASSHSYADQLASLRREFDEQKQAQEEAQDLLEQARGDLEAIQSELLVKEEEIERLRETVVRPASPGANTSLDEEMLSAMKQQHSLELSAAQSEIRALENSVYQAEAKAHALQKQVAEFEDQLVHVRPNSRTSQRPTVPPRVSSRNIDTSDELRRASFNSVRSASHLRPTSPPSSFEGLSAETRHKRRVSLGMLKARIDSEAAAAKTHPSSRASPVQKISGLPTVIEPTSAPQSPKRTSQYLDDSHIFWCHSCRGDLVIL